MNDLDRLRQTVAVLELLDKSARAHAEGRHADSDRYAAQVCELDVDAVAIITGGMRIGEIPSPEHEPLHWAEYLAANQDRLARLESETANA